MADYTCEMECEVIRGLDGKFRSRQKCLHERPDGICTKSGFDNRRYRMITNRYPKNTEAEAQRECNQATPPLKASCIAMQIARNRRNP